MQVAASGSACSGGHFPAKMGENSKSVGAWPSGSGGTGRNETELEQAPYNSIASGGNHGPSQQLIAITDEDDFYKMSPQIKVEYDEVFKEPEIYAKYFSIRKASQLVYSWTQIAVYIIFSILFGIILAFVWGIVFAILNFFAVFIMQPTAKALFVILRTNAMILRATVRSNLDPFYESFGLFFSRIKGRFSFNTTGILPTVVTTGRTAIREM